TAALTALEAVAPLVAAAPPDVQKNYESAKKDASAGAARQQKEMDLSKTIVAGSSDMSQTIVAGSAEYSQSSMKHAVAAPPSAAAAPRRAPIPAPPPPKKSPVVPIVIVVVLLIAAVGGYFAFVKGGGTVAATSYIEINAVPWGTVKTVTSANGKVKIDVNQE